jgi:hypothetical protein
LTYFFWPIWNSELRFRGVYYCEKSIYRHHR